MTPSERFLAERERITAATGTYITPGRRNDLVKAAGRITEILVKATTCMSYAECRIVLRLVDAAITEATTKEGSTDDDQGQAAPTDR